MNVAKFEDGVTSILISLLALVRALLLNSWGVSDELLGLYYLKASNYVLAF